MLRYVASRDVEKHVNLFGFGLSGFLASTKMGSGIEATFEVKDKIAYESLSVSGSRALLHFFLC